MGNIVTSAIVLRHVNYRDNDRMLTLFSPELGRMEAVARGCRKQGSALGNATELFTVGEFHFATSRERNTLTGCAMQDCYYPLRQDYDRLLYGSYLLNLCEAAVQPGEGQPDLYAQLLASLAYLTYAQPPVPPDAVATVFLMLFAEEQGYKPVLGGCLHCGQVRDGSMRFDPLAGGVVCGDCSPSGRVVSPEALAFLRVAQRERLDALKAPVSADAQRQAFSLMRLYMESRLEKTMKAAALLPRIG